MNRYYWSRVRTGPTAGSYRIIDRVLDTYIAICNFRENAELIVGALNSIQPKVKANEPAKLIPCSDHANDAFGFPNLECKRCNPNLRD